MGTAQPGLCEAHVQPSLVCSACLLPTAQQAQVVAAAAAPTTNAALALLAVAGHIQVGVVVVGAVFCPEVSQLRLSTCNCLQNGQLPYGTSKLQSSRKQQRAACCRSPVWPSLMTASHVRKLDGS